MANSTIKITQLPPIGNNLTASTILPVVSLTGTATTDKVAVSNIANFTLLNAGNTLPPAYLSNLTYSVVNAAQPNITSLGNLSGLRITNLSNFYLPGGTNGQLLSTNGSGNLTWVTGNVGGGTPGGSNSQVQFNNNGNFAGNSAFTFDSTNSILTTTNFVSVNANITGALTTPSLAVTGTSNTRNIIANGNITANFFIGSGSQLSNISGANVSGNVPNATFATTSANANFATTANYSAFAGNVTINAQANITSLGNLTGLQSNGAVFINNNTNSTSNATGALRVLGGIGATGNIHSGNEIHSRGNVIVGGNTLFVGPTAEATGLTNPAMVIFHAGDQYIQAALKNSLSNGSADWVAYGDNGTDSQGWSDMGFTSSTFNDANYTITGSGDGYLFVETFAGSYGGNLVIATGNLGTVKDIIFATDGFLTENEFGRISDSNNSFELTRTGATITFPDGSIQSTAYTGGGGDTGNVTFNNVNIIGDGNLYLQPDPANVGAYLDIYLTSGPDIHIAGNGETVILGTDDFANVAVNVDGNVSIQAGDANGTYTWNFGTDGNLTLPDTTSVIANVSITLEANDTGNITGLSVIGDYHANLYAHGNVKIVSDSSNTTPTWTFDNDGNLTLPQLTTISDESVIGATLTIGVPPTVIVISGADFSPVNTTYTKTGAATPTWEPAGYNPATDPYIEFSGGEYGIFNPGFVQALYVNSGTLNKPLIQWNINPPLGSVAPTAVYTYGASGPDWVFGADGSTIFPTLTVQRGDNPSGTITGQTLLFGDAAQEAIISTADGTANNENSQRLVINPGQGYDYGEGGDIYLWAGRGGDGSGSGGDIKIRGGFAPADGTGGYIRIDGGESQGNGAPGFIEITGGQGGTTTGGYVQITGGVGGNGTGGAVDIIGGFGNQGPGANVSITGGGSANGLSEYGNVNINAGASAWHFDNTGNLTLPAGGSLYSLGSTPSGNPGNTIILQPAGSGVTTDQRLLIYPTAGDGDHIHLTSGNLYQTELFLGNDNFFVKLANTGNIIINSDDNAGNTAQWKFSTDGNLTASGNLIIAGNTNVFGTDAALIQSTDDLPLIAISSGANGAIATSWVEDIGNIGTSNIASVYANPIPGSKIIRIAVGQNGGSGPNLWDFNANGTTTFPGDLIGNGASPAPSISGFNSANFAGNVTANYFLGNGSQLTNLPAPSVAQDITSNGAMSIMTYDGNLKYVNYATVEPSSGNIAGGNISATGNVTANNYIGNGNTLSNVAIQTTGNWTLAPGVNTVSITVPINGTYSIWVRGNIPNGIVTYTATVVVTNTNVPVVGSSYGWYYAAGNALVLTAIPTQIVGTVNNISNAVVSTTTANVFTFDITNNSGSSQVVNWGYTKL